MRLRSDSKSAMISQMTKASAPQQQRSFPFYLALLALLVVFFGYNYKGSSDYLTSDGIGLNAVFYAVSYVAPKVNPGGLNDTNEYCPDGKTWVITEAGDMIAFSEIMPIISTLDIVITPPLFK